MKNSDYTNYIRGLPCVILKNNFRVDAHHSGVVTFKYRGNSKRLFDYGQVPLNHDLHMELHEIGEEHFWVKYKKSPTKIVIGNLISYCETFSILNFPQYNKNFTLEERKDYILELAKFIDTV